MQGIRAKIYATEEQSKTLLHWIAASRFVYNQKVLEDKYLRTFARKYLPVGTFPEIDYSYAHFKEGDGGWLNAVPSQVLRDATKKWFHSYQRFFQKLGGRPTLQKRDKGGDIVLESNLFKIVRQTEKHVYIFIGQKKNNVGIIKVRKTKEIADLSSAKQLRISYRKRQLTLSCSFGEENQNYIEYANETIDYLSKNSSLEELLGKAEGADRGITTPVQTTQKAYDLSQCQKNKIIGKEKFIKRQQKRLARQVKGSKRRDKTKAKIQKKHAEIHNQREDFAHKTSHAMLIKSDKSILGIENLNVAGMTKRPKKKNGQRKGKKAKAGLNKSILSKCWGSIGTKLGYKSQKNHKILVKINPAYTSQMCSSCGHINHENRNGKTFLCISCAYHCDADINAAENIKAISVAMIHLGHRLSKKGVFETPKTDTARRELNKTLEAIRLIKHGSMKREPISSDAHAS